jgi:hypothetical protein
MYLRERTLGLLQRSAVNFCEIVASFGALANQLAHRVAARELLDERRPRFLVADLRPHGFEHRRL